MLLSFVAAPYRCLLLMCIFVLCICLTHIHIRFGYFPINLNYFYFCKQFFTHSIFRSTHLCFIPAYTHMHAHTHTRSHAHCNNFIRARFSFMLPSFIFHNCSENLQCFYKFSLFVFINNAWNLVRKYFAHFPLTMLKPREAHDNWNENERMAIKLAKGNGIETKWNWMRTPSTALLKTTAASSYRESIWVRWGWLLNGVERSLNELYDHVYVNLRVALAEWMYNWVRPTERYALSLFKRLNFELNAQYSKIGIYFNLQNSH